MRASTVTLITLQIDLTEEQGLTGSRGSSSQRTDYAV